MKNDFSKKIQNRYVKIFIAVLVFFALIIGFRMFGNSKRYMSNVYYSKLASDEFENDDYGVLDTYNAYVDFVNTYHIENKLTDKNFDEKSFIYYVFEMDTCAEKIEGVKDVSVENETAYVVFDVNTFCDNCDVSKYVYFIPVSKDEIVDKVYTSFRTSNSKECDIEKTTLEKPILYLYPTSDMNVRVRLEKADLLLTTYPKYNDGWNMFVKTNGDMYDDNNNYYYALYWDEKNIHNVSFDEGFYVTKDNAISFLEDKLSIIGLSDRERNEFIMYWLPRLENNGKSLVYFELTEEREKNNRLLISPQPDSILRVMMHVKRVNKKISIKEQTLKRFERNGFVAVEWGGTIYS